MDRWLERDAGPMVRPYLITRGRTAPDAGTTVGLIDLVVVGLGRPAQAARLSPEHTRIIRLCQRPCAVVDLASEVDLPIGVVRVLLGDLIGQGIIVIAKAAPRGPVTDRGLLQDVLHGLQAL